MTTAVLEFEEYPGDEVVVRIAPIALGDYFDIRKARYAAHQPDEWLALFDRFATLALESWTFPEPATGEGLRRRELPFALALIDGWAEGVRTVPLPLARRSSAGATSEDPNP